MELIADNERLIQILWDIKKKSFVAGYNATDEEAMGLLVARFFGGSGLSILKVTYNALEDSNFHTVNKKIDKIIKEMEVK